MAFTPVYHSQNDPQWKNQPLGTGTGKDDTLGMQGCAVSSVAMLLSGHGNYITPATLNQRLREAHGFSANTLINWWTVSKICPEVKFVKKVPCENTDAPLAEIDDYLQRGQPVIVRVDYNVSPKLDNHYVVVYDRTPDRDYLMLDPYPYPSLRDRQDLITKRYGYDRGLARTITQVVFYEAQGVVVQHSANAAFHDSPSVVNVRPIEPIHTPVVTGSYARVVPDIGLNIRSSPEKTSVNIVKRVRKDTILTILDSGDLAKIGKKDHWVRVRTPLGTEGFVMAEYLERSERGPST